MRTDPDMKPEYDFSNGTRGAVIPNTGKTRITIYIDNDILDTVKARGEAECKGYQTILNELLRKQLIEPPLAETLRQIIREELQHAA